NPVLHLAITESHIPASWFGLSEINFVEKAMLPNSNGTPLVLQMGMKDTISYTFTVPAGADRQNIEVVAFIQDPASKVVFNGAVESLEGPTSTFDAAILDFETAIGSRLCLEDPLAPEVLIENNGAAILTSLDINYSVNNEGVQTLNWTGSLAYGETEVVGLPALSFTQLPTANELKVFVSNPNGSQDQEGTNDLIIANFDYPTHNPGTFQLVITPDVKGSEITWEMINEKDGSIVAAGGPYFDGSTSLIVQQFSVGANTGCYTFNMKDAGGDGMQEFSAGNYQLRDSKGNIVAISADGDYGGLDQSQFSITFATAIEPLAAGLVKVFPNPTSSLLNVEMPELSAQNVDLKLYQLNGALVAKANTQSGQHQFDLSDQPAGIYMLKVQTAEGVFVQKFTKQ
ncbi:MAG: T9SS type A sorting domain-containing protein, partial [Bacteroidota bacterium]